MRCSRHGTIEVGTTLKPGDKISASVTRTGTSYALKLTDSTTSGNNISVTKTCALATCKDTSAEWISERPSFSIGIVPQAHYNAFKLTSGSRDLQRQVRPRSAPVPASTPSP